MSGLVPPNHWVERPAASFGWTVEAAAAHPLRYVWKDIAVAVALLASGYTSVSAKCFPAGVYGIASSSATHSASVVKVAAADGFECAMTVEIKGVSLSGFSDSKALCKAPANSEVMLKTRAYCCDESLDCVEGAEIVFLEKGEGGLARHLYKRAEETFHAADLGISIVLPATGRIVNRSANHFRVQNYVNVNPKDGLPLDLFYVGMSRHKRAWSEMIRKCAGKPERLPHVRDGVWCRLGPDPDDTGDGGPTHAAFLPSADSAVSVGVGGGLPEAEIVVILRSIKRHN